ncbi:hypothetical protein [Oxobacter pfennigii]|nr:hypothetical protein [Oxobacter pfennigii]
MDLKEIMENGLKTNLSCNERYTEFNRYFDSLKPQDIPHWVKRSTAIYGSLNFKIEHYWHSHSALLAFNINEDECWIGNENSANIFYEPFILQDIGVFKYAKELVKTRGSQWVRNYWNNSLSFKKNLKDRRDFEEGYDAEVLIMHDIPPKDIRIVKIVSDHCSMNISEWDEKFLYMSKGSPKGCPNYFRS